MADGDWWSGAGSSLPEDAAAGVRIDPATGFVDMDLLPDGDPEEALTPAELEDLHGRFLLSTPPEPGAEMWQTLALTSLAWQLSDADAAGDSPPDHDLFVPDEPAHADGDGAIGLHDWSEPPPDTEQPDLRPPPWEPESPAGPGAEHGDTAHGDWWHGQADGGLPW